MDPIAARVIAGVCIALCGALPEEGADVVANTLKRWGDDPKNHHEERYIYKVIAEAVGTDVADLTAEIERLQQCARSRFQVIEGGAA